MKKLRGVKLTEEENQMSVKAKGRDTFKREGEERSRQRTKNCTLTFGRKTSLVTFKRIVLIEW